MIRRRGCMAIAAVCSLVWAGVAVAQGLYWESKSTGIGKEPQTTQNYAMPKMMRTVGGHGHTFIVRVDQHKVLTVDTDKHTYREMTFDEMETAGKAMQAQMEAARGEMAKRMKEMSPEQRAMMEKMMPNVAAEQASSVDVKNTGETKIIDGYTCTKYVATAGDKTVLTAWTTKDVKGFDMLRDDWIAYQKRMAGMEHAIGGRIAAAYSKIEGFPMETEFGQIKTVVTKVEPRTIPASEFEVPAGYKKESSNLPKAPPQ